MLDSDKAGNKALFSNIKKLLENGLDVTYKSFPEGEDPDSYFDKREFKEVFQLEEKSGLEYYFKFLKENQQSGFEAYVDTMVELKKVYQNPLLKNEVQTLVEEYFSIKSDTF